MRTLAAVALVAVAAGGGCGGDPRLNSRPTGASPRSTDFVASPTLGRGDRDVLFSIPGLGRFRATCVRPGIARIVYLAERGGATQLMSRQTAAGARPSEYLNPGERAAITIRSRSAPRADWQIALLSEGRVDVFTGSFTVAVLGDRFGCFVAAKGSQTARSR
jgi:hypothetical protein